jgi:predicted phage terminase large subunit-like protein
MGYIPLYDDQTAVAASLLSSRLDDRSGLRRHRPSLIHLCKCIFLNDRDIFDRSIYGRGLVRGSLGNWAVQALRDSGHTPAAHHLLLIAELEKLSHGESDRLMVLMPPGSAKSTYASVLFPAWWFTQHPSSSIISASHSLGLASHFSRKVRALIIAKSFYLGYSMSEGQRSAEHWAINTGGDYLGIGVRGAIAGRRADLIIIDDPIRSRAEAENPRQRDFVWEWFKSDLTTRLRPGGKIVLIMTRWHPEDLGGQILARTPAEWRVLRLPALAEPGDPLGRLPGAALWPDWEDHTALLRKRQAIGERAWSALFQQNPHPTEGKLFAVGRLEIVERHDQNLDRATIRAWDLAATGSTGQNDPDWTVGLKLAQQHDGRYVVTDLLRIRGSAREVEELVVSTARHDGTTVIVGIPEDPGQAGKSQSAYLVRQLAGFHVIAARETGSKATRAMPVASQIEAGNVTVLRGEWNHGFIDELRDFPYGRKDDQVDALVRAFTTLAGRPRTAKAVNLPIFNR